MSRHAYANGITGQPGRTLGRTGAQAVFAVSVLGQVAIEAPKTLTPQGFANQDAPISDLPGIASGSLVETPAGPVPVDTLHPGAVVLTGEGAPSIVQSITAHDAVTAGRQAAIRLRAPYFGLSGDLFLAPNTPLTLCGPEVEYTFGCEEVLARAGDLADGATVLRDLSQPVRRFHHLVLDRSGDLRSGRCRIAAETQDAQFLDATSVRSLLAMMPDARGLLA